MGYDALYLCANAINNGARGYNNLQWFGGTFYHKFDENWHFAMESYYRRKVLKGNSSRDDKGISTGRTAREKSGRRTRGF